MGPLVYTVIDSEWQPSLGVGPAPRVPKARFLIVNMSVVNGGSSEQSLPTFMLEDDQGETYPELDSGEEVPDWIGFGRKIRPAESLSGNIAFDVTPKHYKLKLIDENTQVFASVDVPLTFGPPPIPPPDAGPVPTTVPSIKR